MRDTYRLAAMYDSFEEYKEKQPLSHAEAKAAGMLLQVKAIFKPGVLERYREGGSEVKGTGPLKVDKRRKEHAELRVNAGRRITRRSLEIAARAHLTLADFFVAEPEMENAAHRLHHVKTLERFFAREFGAAEVMEEMAEFDTYDEFAKARPKYAVEAVRLGIAEGAT